MSAPTKLMLPTPKMLGQQLVGSARIDKPLALSLPAVKGVDGAALAAEAQVGYFLYRMGPAGEELWNEATQAWQANPGEDALGQGVAPVLMSNTGDSGWTAALNPTTLLDATGAPRFTTAPPTQYFMRVLVSVGNPATTSRKCPDRTARLRHWRSTLVRV